MLMTWKYDLLGDVKGDDLIDVILTDNLGELDNFSKSTDKVFVQCSILSIHKENFVLLFPTLHEGREYLDLLLRELGISNSFKFFGHLDQESFKSILLFSKRFFKRNLRLFFYWEDILRCFPNLIVNWYHEKAGVDLFRVYINLSELVNLAGYKRLISALYKINESREAFSAILILDSDRHFILKSTKELCSYICGIKSLGEINYSEIDKTYVIKEEEKQKSKSKTE